MKQIKTDNQMTLTVMQALEDFKQLQKGFESYSRVPFMQRELSKHEKAKQR